MKLLIMGPPGAGKGTQAKILAEKFNLVHLSTGDILRSEIDKGSSMGLEAQSYMNAGNLVPDKVLLSMPCNCRCGRGWRRCSCRGLSRCGSWGRCGGRCSIRPNLVKVVENVLAGDAPARAGAGNCRRVDAMLIDQSPHDRREQSGVVFTR